MQGIPLLIWPQPQSLAKRIREGFNCWASWPQCRMPWWSSLPPALLILFALAATRFRKFDAVQIEAGQFFMLWFCVLSCTDCCQSAPFLRMVLGQKRSSAVGTASPGQGHDMQASQTLPTTATHLGHKACSQAFQGGWAASDWAASAWAARGTVDSASKCCSGVEDLRKLFLSFVFLPVATLGRHCMSKPQPIRV